MALRNLNIKQDTHTPKFIAALFTIARAWIQLKCPSMGGWIKVWHIYIHTYMYTHTHTHTHTLEYYSAIKRDEIVPFAEVWMDLETVTE